MGVRRQQHSADRCRSTGLPHSISRPRSDVRVAAAAWALAAVLATTGTLHFTSPGGFRSIVPGLLGSPPFWVAASGVAELGCALTLSIAATRRPAGWACAILFVAVYPANITMVVHAVHGDGNELISWLRLPLQIPLVIWALYIARNGWFRRGDRASEALRQAL